MSGGGWVYEESGWGYRGIGAGWASGTETGGAGWVKLEGRARGYMYLPVLVLCS